MLYRIKDALKTAHGRAFWLQERSKTYRDNWNFVAADDAAALKVAETLQAADDAMAAEYAYEESDCIMDRSGIRQNLDKYAPKYAKALVRVEKDREIPVRAPGTKEATE